MMHYLRLDSFQNYIVTDMGNLLNFSVKIVMFLYISNEIFMFSKWISIGGLSCLHQDLHALK
jgi:hypothetical protein